MRWAWISLGAGCVALGAVAALLPLVPTTPFLLVAAFAFARSSERFHQWLTQHPRLGPPIRDWNEGRLVRRSAKRLATVSIALAFAFSVVIGLPVWVLAAQAVVLSGVVAYIWSRPEPVAVDVRPVALATADLD
jgi:uncharacterized membrane protein YbaN (DUF454 family)